MQNAKKKRLENAGWRVGTAEEFLELTPEEAELVEVRLALSDTLREKRDAAGLSQVELARKVGSSQSRVAKMEAGDPSVSMDLLMRTLFATGATRADVAHAIAPRAHRRNTSRRGPAR